MPDQPDGGRRPVGGVGRGEGPVDPVERGRGERVEEAGRSTDQPHREAPLAERPDQFRRAGILERFRQSIAERMERGWLYQTFRLPGTSRMVRDQRDGGASARADRTAQRGTDRGVGQGESRHPDRSTAAASKGQAAALRPTVGIAQAGEVGGKPMPDAGDAAAIEGLLTAFFQKLVARFEQGEQSARSAADGLPHFLHKTAAQWKAFFLAVLPRTEKKQVSMDQVAAQMTFRGLLKKGSDPATGVVIGDLQLTNGTLEKFARFDVALQHVLQAMAALPPGSPLTKEVIQKGIAGQLLEYLAIGPPRGDAEGTTARRETPGVFTSLRTEAEIARQLGIIVPDQTATPQKGAEGTPQEARTVRHRRAGLGKLFGEEEPISDEQPGQFIPWWRWDREERLGLRRWFTAVTIGTIIALLAVGTWALFRLL